MEKMKKTRMVEEVDIDEALSVYRIWQRKHRLSSGPEMSYTQFQAVSGGPRR